MYPPDKGWVTGAERRQMKQWRVEGHSLSDICAWTGRDRKTVIKYVRGVHAPLRPVRVCRPAIMWLLGIGMTPAETARALGCTASVIHYATKGERARANDRARAKEAHGHTMGHQGSGVHTTQDKVVGEE